MSDIKNKLIKEIEKIDDDIILNQLTQLITESDQGIIAEFSQEQIESIKDSQNQIRNGDSYDHDHVMKLIDED